MRSTAGIHLYLRRDNLHGAGQGFKLQDPGATVRFWPDVTEKSETAFIENVYCGFAGAKLFRGQLVHP